MILNNQILDRLKEKANLSFDKAKDFTILSSSIFEETKRSIGITTIKRLLGYIDDNRKTNAYTLNTIAIYLGYKTWNELCCSLRIDSDWNFEDKKVYIDDLKVGKEVIISYWDRQVSFVVTEFNNQKALKVKKVINSSLKEGDILIIQCLEIGKIIEAKEIYRNNCIGNYRTNNELSEIHIV